MGYLENGTNVEKKMISGMRYLIVYFAAAMTLIASFPAEVAGQAADVEISRSEERRQSRLFDSHTVRMGETTFSIARGYAISPLILAEDNPEVDLAQIKAGQVLLVRKRERGKTDPAQVAREWRQLTTDKAEAPTDKPDAPGVSGNEALGTDPSQPDPEGDVYDEWLRLQGAERAGVERGDRGVWDRDSEDRETGRDRNSGRGRELDGRRDFGSGGSPSIALMLPLTGTNRSSAGNEFTDFYKGALLALEDLKADGHSATVTLYDTGNSVGKTQNIVTSAEFMDTDLIIGPVFEEETEPAVQFGEYFGVPVVSPLATMRSLDSGVLFQMASDAGSKYDKLRPVLEGDVNIIVVSSGEADDAAFAGEIEAELSKMGRNYGRFTIGGRGEIASLIDWTRPNVMVVLAGNELTVNQALTAISSSYNKASATRSRRAEITVVGNSRWANFDGTSIDLNLFFKLNVKFVTSYYINRSDPKTRHFEARYFEAYGDFPSRSAFRGYDAVALFAGALFESGFSFTDRLDRVGATPLDTSYRFVRAGDIGGGNDANNDSYGGDIGGGGGGVGGRKFVNDQWTLVSFSNDYQITTDSSTTNPAE